jgi:hypothetical protein
MSLGQAPRQNPDGTREKARVFAPVLWERFIVGEGKNELHQALKFGHVFAERFTFRVIHLALCPDRGSQKGLPPANRQRSLISLVYTSGEGDVSPQLVGPLHRDQLRLNKGKLIGSRDFRSVVICIVFHYQLVQRHPVRADA